MGDDYYVISTSEDGDVDIEGPLSKAEVEKRFTPEPGEQHGYYGPRPVFGSVTDVCEERTFFKHSDGMSRGYVPPRPHRHDLTSKAGIFVIKGRIVTPKPVSTVTKWEVE